VSRESRAREDPNVARTPRERAVQGNVRDQAFGFLSLLTSFGPLICCALPSLLVLFGLGATVASFLSAAPWLVTLSRQKAWVFAGSGTLIALNVLYVYVLAPRLRGADDTCPVNQPSACGTADRVSRAVLWISVAIYDVGFFTAYLLGPILEWLA
jgi:mercuric ion transport protein